MPEPHTDKPTPQSSKSVEEIKERFSEGLKFNARCAVCKSSDRVRIEAAVALGRGRRAVAKAFGISEFSVHRHWHRHVSGKMKAARRMSVLKPGMDLEQLVNEATSGVLDRAKAYSAALFWEFDQATQASDHKAMVMLAPQLRKTDEFIARLSGDLVNRTEHTNVSVELTAEVLELQRTIFNALAKHPDARRDVAEALYRLERDAAQRSSPRLIESAANTKEAVNAVPAS